MYNIVYITDKNYILPTKISINSIIQNIADIDITVHVVAVDISEADIESFRNLSSKNVVVKIFCFNNKFENLGRNHLYVSSAALFKFQLPDIFPDLGRILYVDGDMILFRDSLEIFHFDISEKYAAVVQDLLACLMGFDKKIGHEKYFNSGMMYLNLEKMRQDRITELLIEYKKNDGDKSFMDQNALNAILGKDCIWVSPKFNMMATCLPETINMIYKDGKPFLHMADFYGITETEMKIAWQNPAILHMAGETKSWKNISAARIDDLIPYVLPNDMLKVANKCNHEEYKIPVYVVYEDWSDDGNTGNSYELYTDYDMAKLSEQEGKIEALQMKLSETYSLLINTRHRTLYGACAWLSHKLFKKKD